MFMFVIYEDLRSYAYSVITRDYQLWLLITKIEKKKKPFEINKNNDDICISQ